MGLRGTALVAAGGRVTPLGGEGLRRKARVAQEGARRCGAVGGAAGRPQAARGAGKTQGGATKTSGRREKTRGGTDARGNTRWRWGSTKKQGAAQGGTRGGARRLRVAQGTGRNGARLVRSSG